MNKKFLTIALILIIAAGVGLYQWQSGANKNQPPEPTVSTENKNAGWKTFTPAEKGVSFQYPEKFDAQYISTQEWPPQVIISQDHQLTCPETPAQSSLPQRIIRQTINGRVYCVRALSEGAAGSVYTEYSYSTGENGLTQAGQEKIITVNFTLRYPQCGNYDELQKTQCEQEREAFNLDDLIDRIVQTARLN